MSRNLKWLVVLAGLASATAFAKQPPRSPRASVALEFLRRLESGQAEAARLMLSPFVAQLYPAERLAALAPGAKQGVRTIRKVRSERSITPNSAYANQLALKFGHGARVRPSYIVCIADVPRSGYGAVSYVAVVLVADPVAQSWHVSDFRYQSEPDDNCK